MSMNCPNCKKSLDLKFKDFLLNKKYEELACPKCETVLRKSVFIPLFVGFIFGIPFLLIFTLSANVTLPFYIRLIVMAVISFLVIFMKPYYVVPKYVESSEEITKWYQAPATYLVPAFIVVLYFMFFN